MCDYEYLYDKNRPMEKIVKCNEVLSFCKVSLDTFFLAGFYQAAAVEKKK